MADWGGNFVSVVFNSGIGSEEWVVWSCDLEIVLGVFGTGS